MLLKDKLIELEITSYNIKHYQKFFENELTKNELVKVKQEWIPKSSHLKLECECELCGKKFTRMRKDIKDFTLCGTKCRNEYLKSISPNKNIPKIKVNCNSCNKEFEVVKSKFENQQYFLCSRNCYKRHRSDNYHGDKIYNYQDLKVTCSNDDCNTEVKIIKFDLKRNNHQFCSQKCYWEFKSNHYTEFYFRENLFDKKETLPEKMVREWLEDKSIKYIPQYYIEHYFADFHLPEFNAIIEVYGDYWHCNPNVYGEGKRKIHPNQIGVWEKDANRVREIESLGYKVDIIWEYDVHNNLENELNRIINGYDKNP